MTPLLRAAVAGGDAFTRHVLRLALCAREVMVVVEAASAHELVPLCSAEDPDVVLLLANANDNQARALVTELSGMALDVLVIGADAAPDVALDLLATGAAGYLTRNVTPDDVVNALHDVRSGGVPLDPRCAAPLVAEWRTQRRVSGTGGVGNPNLSPREVDVLRLLAGGRSTKAVAATLEVSIKTVESHKTRIFAKLGARNQAQAVAAAMAQGSLSLGPDAAGQA